MHQQATASQHNQSSLRVGGGAAVSSSAAGVQGVGYIEQTAAWHRHRLPRLCGFGKGIMLKEDGPRPKYAVIVLLDAAGHVGHVGVRRLDQPTDWVAVWRAATTGEIGSVLGGWLRTLPAPPVERIILGSIGLHLGTARAAGASCLHNGGISRRSVTGSEGVGQLAESSRTAAYGVGGRSMHAASDLGITRAAVLKAVRGGRMLNLL